MNVQAIDMNPSLSYLNLYGSIFPFTSIRSRSINIQPALPKVSASLALNNRYLIQNMTQPCF